MNTREFFQNIANGMMNDEMKQFAADQIVKLDHTNEVRRAANAKKALEKEAERAPMRQAILNVITAEPKTATTLIAEAELELKPQSIPSLLKGLVEDGTIQKVDVKVKGKGTQKGYVRA